MKLPKGYFGPYDNLAQNSIERTILRKKLEVSCPFDDMRSQDQCDSSRPERSNFDKHRALRRYIKNNRNKRES